jgi:hypothetical protein
MELGGNYKIIKDLLMPPHEHMRHFKEMLRIVEQLPVGKLPKPNSRAVLQWYYMTYHKMDCR